MAREPSQELYPALSVKPLRGCGQMPSLGCRQVLTLIPVIVAIRLDQQREPTSLVIVLKPLKGDHLPQFIPSLLHFVRRRQL